MLYLFEELFLLSLDEENGNILSFVKKPFAYGIAGAILSELVFQDKVQLNDKHRLVLKNADPIGDEILDEALHELKRWRNPTARLIGSASLIKKRKSYANSWGLAWQTKVCCIRMINVSSGYTTKKKLTTQQPR